MKILFAGRKPVAARCLEFLAARDGIEVVGVLTDSHLSISPTASAAARLGIPVLAFESVPDCVRAGELGYDLCLSMLYWRKFSPLLLEHPRRGAINFHPAPLPQYKGCGGYNLAVLESCTEWGVTAHYMDEKIDTGEIIEVDRFPIDPESETARRLEGVCQERLYQQFVRVVEQVVKHEARLPTAPNEGGRYVSRLAMEQMKEVRPGDDVRRKIRAFWFPPYDGAFVTVNGVKCTLVDGSILEELADPTSSSLFTASSARPE
ncbi:MAG: formyltransferase family protein [Caldimonas sp.]